MKKFSNFTAAVESAFAKKYILALLGFAFIAIAMIMNYELRVDPVDLSELKHVPAKTVTYTQLEPTFKSPTTLAPLLSGDVVDPEVSDVVFYYTLFALFILVGALLQRKSLAAQPKQE